MAVDVLRYVVMGEFLLAAGFLLGMMARKPRECRLYLYGFGVSYLLLLLLGWAEVQLRLGHEATFHTAIAATAGTVAAATMVLLYWRSTR